jgi:hypothetical protein
LPPATRRAGLRQEAEALQASLKAAASKYRDVLLAGRPDVPPDLVSGETVEEVDQQLEAALRMVAQLRSHLESQAQALFSRRLPLALSLRWARWRHRWARTCPASRP